MSERYNNNVYVNHFYNKYHFKIIKQKKKIGKYYYYSINEINDDYRNNYNVVKTKCIYSDLEFNEKGIMNDAVIERENIQLDDILFGIKVINKKKSNCYYCKNYDNVNDIINLITHIDNSDNITFIFVSLSFYKLLYDDYKEYKKQKNTCNDVFKQVKQEWDYENQIILLLLLFTKQIIYI